MSSAPLCELQAELFHYMRKIEKKYPLNNSSGDNGEMISEWLEWHNFLVSRDIIRENLYKKENPISDEYIVYHRGRTTSGTCRILLEWKMDQENFICSYSRIEKNVLWNTYFTRPGKEREGLALGLFCLRKLKQRYPDIILRNCIDINGKQISIEGSIHDAWEILHPRDFLSESIAFDTRYEKIPLTDFLQGKTGWRVIMDRELSPKDKAKIDSQIQDLNLRADGLKEFYLQIQCLIFEKLKKTPLGVYFLDKFGESIRRKAPDLQIVHFIQGVTTIYINKRIEKNAENPFDYRNFKLIDGGNDPRLSIQVHIHPSIFQSVSNSFMAEMDELGTLSDEEFRSLIWSGESAEQYSTYSKEDYLRILYAVARECRNTAGHFASDFQVKNKVSEFFGDDYKQEEIDFILDILCQRSILSRGLGVYRFRNKAYRLFVDGFGTAKYTEEDLITFISGDNSIDSNKIGVNDSGNSQFDHIDELSYETVMIFSAAFLENTKNRDRVLKQLLEKSEDFNVRNRKLQASCIHTLSYILLDCDQLIPSKLREKIFITAFGKNAYPLQKKIGHHLLKQKFYKDIYDAYVRASFETETESGFHYAKEESLFFLHANPEMRSNADSEEASLKYFPIKNVTPDFVKAIELFDLFWNGIRTTQATYKCIMKQIEAFVHAENIGDEEHFLAFDDIMKIHCAEYLLYAFADACQSWEIHDATGLRELLWLAVCSDYSKKKKCRSYNQKWYSEKMYMSCGAARALSVLAHQNIFVGQTIILSSEAKLDYLRWLRTEIRAAYERTKSLRYILFMIRLLLHTDLKTQIEEVILNPYEHDVSTEKMKEKAESEGKRNFIQCYETTLFLKYDAFPPDYNSVCECLHLDRLKKTDSEM